MTPVTTNLPNSWTSDPDLWRCIQCGGLLTCRLSELDCVSCGRAYPIRDGVMIAKDGTSENNEVAREFYDGPLWPKFRFWEWVTFVLNGGERRSRNKILRHLPSGNNLHLLDVAIGDGVYLDWLNPSWSVTGIDVSRVQLDACRGRLGGHPRNARLVLGEAEDLPFQSHRFDAVLSIGGFNYFNDPEGSLREMARVVKPGGTIVVADEVPNLTDQAWFHKIGLPGLDRWLLSKIFKNLGEDFTDLVKRKHDLDIEAIGRRVLVDCRYELIWRKVGYVLVGRSPG